MSINESLFPKISSVPLGTVRPLWSVIIPTYNRPDLLADCLESILAQSIPTEQMQILVVDDCSPTDIESLVRKVGNGRIQYHRHDHNLGNSATFNTGINLATGEWIHILHDDDWVLPNFYNKFQQAITKFPDSNTANSVGAICCRYAIADSNKNWSGLSQLHQSEGGILQNWLSIVATNNPVSPPAVVIRRSVYERLGGFYGGFISSNSEDWEMYKRVAVFYNWWFEPEVLACYRQHEQSITSHGAAIGLRTADIRTNIELSYEYLPVEIRDQITAIARRNYALFSLKRAIGMLDTDIFGSALREIQEGLKISSEPVVINALFKEVLSLSSAEPLRNAIAELLIDIALFNNSEL